MWMRRLLLLGLLLCPSVVAAQGGLQPLAPPLVNCFTGQSLVPRAIDGINVLTRCLRDGARVEAPWVQALSLEGRVFCANFGSGTTVITGKTAFTAGSPEANVDVPQGTTVIPIYQDLNVVAATGTANHFWFQVNGNLTGNGTSSAGPTPVNIRVSDRPYASVVTTRQAYSAAGTAPTTSFEVWHLQNAVAASTSTPWSWTYPQGPVILPTIIGPGSMSMHSIATTTAATFQLRMCWIELPSSAAQ